MRVGNSHCLWNNLAFLVGLFSCFRVSDGQGVPQSVPWQQQQRQQQQVTTTDPHKVVVPVNNLRLTPENEIQFIEGYFSGEGYIDLTNLIFSPTNENNGAADQSSSSSSFSTHLDVAVVRVPTAVCSQAPTSMATITESCPKSAWMEHVGLGASMGGGSSSWWWCCNSKMAQQCPDGTSTSSSSPFHPHLMIHEQDMDGTLRHVDVTARNTTIRPAEEAQFVAEEGGYFVIVMANCDDQTGQAITVHGEVVFVSLQEDLDKMIKEEVPFYAFTSIAFMCLFFWFGFLMHQNKESRIRLEEWIFVTIAVGFAEAILRCIEYVVWEKTGHRNVVMAFLAAVAFGAKHGISRGLLVLLSTGVGVTKPTLEPKTNATLVTLTSAYIGLSTTLNYLGYVEQQRAADIQGVTYDDTSLAQVMWFLLVGTVVIDLIFLVWIPVSLSLTIHHLRDTNQERKLERFRWLFWILFSAVGMSLAVFAALVLDVVYDQGRLAYTLDLSKVNEINVFLIILLIAILWKPNPMAREYAYVMEAATEDDNDLELTESTSTGLPPSPDSNYNKFPIESAEAT